MRHRTSTSSSEGALAGRGTRPAWEALRPIQTREASEQPGHAVNSQGVTTSSREPPLSSCVLWSSEGRSPCGGALSAKDIPDLQIGADGLLCLDVQQRAIQTSDYSALLVRVRVAQVPSRASGTFLSRISTARELGGSVPFYRPGYYLASCDHTFLWKTLP